MLLGLNARSTRAFYGPEEAERAVAHASRHLFTGGLVSWGGLMQDCRFALSSEIVFQICASFSNIPDLRCISKSSANLEFYFEISANPECLFNIKRKAGISF